MDFNIIDFANISLVLAFLTGLSYCLCAVINLRSSIVAISSCDRETNSKINLIKNKTDEKIEELHQEVLSIKILQSSQKSKIEKLESIFTNEDQIEQKKKSM